MNWKIVWSDFAEKQVAEIYAFYEKKAGASAAKKLVKGIINEPTKLLQTVHISQLCVTNHTQNLHKKNKVLIFGVSNVNHH